MIPYRDDNPTSRFPIMTVLIIVANALVFLYQQSLPSGGRQIGPQEAFIAYFAAIPANILFDKEVMLLGRNLYELPMLDPGWLTIFTSMFMHGGWAHLLGNMLFLWIFGNNIEDLLGRVRFLIFYLICGVAAAALQIMMSLSPPAQYIPMVGASGAIAGVLGGYIIKFPTARVRTLILFVFITVVELPAYVVLGMWFIFQFFSAATSLFGTQLGGVAFFAHVGGFVAGMLLVGIFSIGRRIPRLRNYRYD